MLSVCPLFSGSEGNSTYIENDQLSFLVDAGRSAKQLKEAIIRNGFNPDKIKFILVTHEHSDHVKGLGVFARKYNIKIFASSGTLKELENKNIIDNRIDYQPINDILEIDNVRITPFEISHDCAQGYGYSILFRDSNLKISVCSDLGFVSDSVFNSILGSDLILIESNHDLEMLKNGSYPIFLKQRILSNHGHLSNVACSDLLPKLAMSGTKKFILCHLSSNNNTRDIAYNSAFNSLKNSGKDFELYVAPKENFGNLNIKY